MASYSAGLGEQRKLKRVNTFKDMSRDRPSSQRSQSQQPASLASATGRAPIAGDPRVPAPRPGLFDRGQRSPFFANVPNIPAPEAETEEEAEAQAEAGASAAEGGVPGVDQPSEAWVDEPEYEDDEDGEDGEIDWGGLGESDPFGLGGLGEGLSKAGDLLDPWDDDDDDAPPPPLGGGDDDDGDELDDWFNEEMRKHEEAWPAKEKKIQTDLARGMRHMVDIQGGMGSSVAGGWGSAMTDVILKGAQLSADAFAAHQREGRQLQFAWLEKKSDRDFQRELAEGDRQSDLLQALFNSGVEISQDMIDAIMGPGYEGDGLDFLGGGDGGGGGDAPEGTTQDEEGLYVTADGDYLMGDEGRGTTGTVQADPYAEDGEEFQWYATTNREDEPGGQSYWSERDDDEYGYYRLNRETGEKIWWRGTYGGPRYPGDRSFYNREYGSRNTNDREGWRPGGIRINGYDENEQNRGEWARGEDVTEAMNYIGEEYGWRKDDNGNYKNPDAPETGENPIRYEIGYFMSWYQTVYDGALPSWEDVEDHLLEAGYISELEEGVTTLSPAGAPNA